MPRVAAATLLPNARRALLVASSLAFVPTWGGCALQPIRQDCTESAQCGEGRVCNRLGECHDEGADGVAPASWRPGAPVWVSSTSSGITATIPPPERNTLETWRLCADAAQLPDPAAATSLCRAVEHATGPDRPVQAELAGLEPGRRYLVRAFSGRDGLLAGGDATEMYTRPAAPTGLAATTTSEPSAITLSWSSVEGALAHRVYRNEVEVAELTGTSWTDLEAPAGGPPDAPTLLLASDDTGGVSIVLRWTPYSAPRGPEQWYRVAAVGVAGEGDRSEPVNASRDPLPLEGYELERGDSQIWQRLGSSERYADLFANHGAITVRALSASNGTSGGVTLTADEPVRVPAAPNLYRVRSRNAAGASAPSNLVTATRKPGFYYYDWDKYDPASRTWRQLSATTQVITDPSPPARGTSCLYRVSVAGVGWIGNTTLGDVGYVAECRTDDDCAGERCSDGRCHPLDAARFAPTVAQLGAADWDDAASEDERARIVTLTRTWLLSTTEVTEADWGALLGGLPAGSVCGDTCPVVDLSWYAALAWLNARSESEGLPPCFDLAGADCSGDVAAGTLRCGSIPRATSTSGRIDDCDGYRLPTEAEWEVAAAGFDSSPIRSLEVTSSSCRLVGLLGDIAWYCGNSEVEGGVCVDHPDRPSTCLGLQSVGRLEPTSFGLHDLFGNASEWVWDRRDDQFAATVTDPIEVEMSPSTTRVVRGGSFYSRTGELRASERSSASARQQGFDRGFRWARTERR